MNYLEKVQSSLARTQAEQINKLLLKYKQVGQITTLEQFKTELNNWTQKLLSNVITPSLEVFLAKYRRVIDSETYNFMLERITDDLETIFTEENTLSNVLDSHINIIDTVVLKALKYGVAELESKIAMYEFIANNPYGFEKGQYNTFRSADITRTGRDSQNIAILFPDHRLGNLIEIDANVDVIGERLVAGTNSIGYIKPIACRQIFDIQAKQSTVIVSDLTDINNLIDGDQSTYWSYSVLQDSQLPLYAKIEIDFGGYYDFNFIEFNSSIPQPMTLEQITYLSPTNTTETISGVTSQVIAGNCKLYFSRITAKQITITVKQVHGLETQYEEKQQNNVEAQLANTISSGIVKDILVVSDQKGDDIQKLEYKVQFNGINFGYAEYEERSIFVSAPLTVIKPTQLAIKTKEMRPYEAAGVIGYTTDTYSHSAYLSSSIEYYLSLYNYDEAGTLIDINHIPVLPFGITRIMHERLYLTNQVDNVYINDSGFLRFFCDPNAVDINVYRNGTLLVRGTDWDIESELSITTPPPCGQPNRICIKITAPVLTDYYTVSYTPFVSNTHADPKDIYSSENDIFSGSLHTVDLVGDMTARIGQNNIIYINHNKGSKQTFSTDVYLGIIIRKNSPVKNITATVDEYVLLASSGNQNKYGVLDV